MVSGKKVCREHGRHRLAGTACGRRGLLLCRLGCALLGLLGQTLQPPTASPATTKAMGTKPRPRSPDRPNATGCRGHRTQAASPRRDRPWHPKATASPGPSPQTPARRWHAGVRPGHPCLCARGLQPAGPLSEALSRPRRGRPVMGVSPQCLFASHSQERTKSRNFTPPPARTHGLHSPLPPTRLSQLLLPCLVIPSTEENKAERARRAYVHSSPQVTKGSRTIA